MIGMKITKEITREHMDTYLTIMVTVLVATQVIRIAQNTIQLHRQNKLIKKEIAHLGYEIQYKQAAILGLALSGLRRIRPDLGA